MRSRHVERVNFRHYWRPKDLRSRESQKPTPSSIALANRTVDIAHRKYRCCPDTSFRTIARSVYDGARDVARAIGKMDAFQQSRR